MEGTMCNAWNHDDECECGFGPPYAFSGISNIVAKTNWRDLAVWNEAAFVRGLKEVIPDKRISEKIREEYKREGFPLEHMEARKWNKMDPERRRKISLSIKKLLGIVKIEKGESEAQTVRIPLFKLHAPIVRGSEVTYHERETETRPTWYVAIGFPGVGMATWKTIKVSYACDVCCANGDCKIIYMPLDVKVTPLKVYNRDGRLINRCLQVEAASKNDNKRFQREVRSCYENPCKDKASSLLDMVDLLKDTSGNPVVRRVRLESSRKHEAFIGVKAFGLDALLKADVEFERVLEIESRLPPRHRYHMFDILDVHGIVWNVKGTGPSARRSGEASHLQAR
jgi:hypothetical protein